MNRAIVAVTIAALILSSSQMAIAGAAQQLSGQAAQRPSEAHEFIVGLQAA